MSEYTSTKEGFQCAMKMSLSGPPDEAKTFCEATGTPNFHQIVNGKHLDYDAWLQSIVEWRGKITNYDPVINEFLRDGNQLAARMTGVLMLDGRETAFESFMFATIDEKSGKIEKLIERAVYGPVGQEPTHGTN